MLYIIPFLLFCIFPQDDEKHSELETRLEYVCVCCDAEREREREMVSQMEME